MSTAVAEPNTDLANLPGSEDEPNLEALSLTPADIDNLSDEEIARRLDMLQLYTQRMRAKVRTSTARTRRIEKTASTVGALVSRMNDVARAEFKQTQANERIEKARKNYDDVLAAYLRVNEITELPAEVQAQLNEAREATITKLQSSASRVKADGADEADSEAAD